MYTDINLSEDLVEKFNAYCQTENSQLGIDFSMLILQAGAWPISQTNLPTFSLPQELEKPVRVVSVAIKISDIGHDYEGFKLDVSFDSSKLFTIKTTTDES